MEAPPPNPSRQRLFCRSRGIVGIGKCLRRRQRQAAQIGQNAARLRCRNLGDRYSPSRPVLWPEQERERTTAFPHADGVRDQAPKNWCDIFLYHQFEYGMATTGKFPPGLRSPRRAPRRVADRLFLFTSSSDRAAPQTLRMSGRRGGAGEERSASSARAETVAYSPRPSDHAEILGVIERALTDERERRR
jgi:hypothetical protein